MRPRAAEPSGSGPRWARRARLGIYAACAVGLLPLWVARASEEELTADVACEERSTPGKVRCSVRVRARGRGARLAWCNALVVDAPANAPPLRTRVARGGR